MLATRRRSRCWPMGRSRDRELAPARRDGAAARRPGTGGAGAGGHTTIAAAVGGETDLDRILELIVKRGRALVEARTVLILLAEGEELASRHPPAKSTTSWARCAFRSQVRLRGRSSGRASPSFWPTSRTGGRWGRVVAAAGRQDRPSGPADIPRADLGGPGCVRPAAWRARVRPRGRAAPAVVRGQRGDRRGHRADRAGRRLRDSIESAEQERGRWARELHDETLQRWPACGCSWTRAPAARRGGSGDRCGLGAGRDWKWRSCKPDHRAAPGRSGRHRPGRRARRP